MRPEVLHTLLEWATGLLIGLMPIIGHLLMVIVLVKADSLEHSWTPDLLFASIATSGTSVFSLFIRLLKGLLSTMRFGPSALILMIFNVLFLNWSGMAYGTYASGTSSTNILWMAVILLICAAITSLYFELALTAAVAVSEDQERDNLPQGA